MTVAELAKHYWRSSGVALFAECDEAATYRCENIPRDVAVRIYLQTPMGSIDAAAVAGGTILPTRWRRCFISGGGATLAAVKAGLAALKKPCRASVPRFS